MTRVPIFRILHLFIRCILLVIYVNASDFNQSCVSVDDFELPAYTNWPFRVDCAHLKTFWTTGPNATTADEFQCIVTHSGNETSEGIFELSSENNDKLYKTQLVVNGTQCLTGDVVINLLQPIPEGECQDVVNDAFERDEIKRLQATIGSHVLLRCIPPEGTPTLIPEGVNRNDFQTYWYTTCKPEEYRTNNLWRTQPDPDGYPDMLNMPSVDFYDATNFTCTVKYRERTLFPFTYAQCIKQAVGNTYPTVTCPKSDIEPKGGVAKLNCGGQLVIGITPSEDFLVEWKKGSDIICRNSVFNRSSPGLHNERISCIVEGNNDSVACVTDGENIPEGDIQRSRKKLALWLNISNLESPDFSEYSVVIRYRDGGSWMDDVSQSIALNEDRERTLFPFTYAQCTKLAAGNTDPTVTCPKSDIEPKGGLAKLNCGGQLVVGITPSEDFLVEWKKSSDIICRNSVFIRSSPELYNGRISCVVKGNNDSVACVTDGENIPEDDIQRSRKKLALWLNISNLESPDFGEYSVVIRYRHGGSWMNEDLTPFYEKNRGRSVQCPVNNMKTIVVVAAVVGFRVMCEHFR